MNSNAKWVFIFIVVLGIWTVVLTSTSYHAVTGAEALVDVRYDLSVLSLPLLATSASYLVLHIFIFVTYLVSYRLAVKHQIEMKVKHEAKKGSNSLDLCSIIIPAKNEESTIRETVMRCFGQTYKNIEVIVVCHNCSDNTSREAGVSDERVKVLELNTRESGKGIALNHGIAHASGKYILVLDADGSISENFIEDMIPLLEQDYVAVQGRYIPSNRNYNFITRMLSIEGDLWSTPFMTIRWLFGRRVGLGGTGYMIRKDILEKEGLYANSLVDDYELTHRLLRKNYRIGFAPLCICFDEKPPSLSLMFNQRARWFKGFFSLLRSPLAKRGDIIGNLYWVNPIAIVSGVLMLGIAGFAGIHNLLFEYYPYEYSYLSIQQWLVLMGISLVVQAMVIVKQYGIQGFKIAAWLPVFFGFSNYWLAASLKSFFVSSWADTKTQHGFVKEDLISRNLTS